MRIFLITGEISGDIYASLLIKRIKEIEPTFHFLTIGGPLVRKCLVENVFSAEKISLVGLPSLKQLREYKYIFEQVKKILIKRKVDLVILIDFPGFNLRVAKFAKKLGYPVIYYVAPQVWAWNKRRINLLKNYVDRLYVILPFEKDFFTREGVRSYYFGHPLLDYIEFPLSESLFKEIYNIPSKKELISFFPGSREKELKAHIPIFVKLAKELKRLFPERFEYIIVKAPGIENSSLWEMAKEEFKVISGHRYEVLKYSVFSVMASGTITIEAGIIGTPGVVLYLAIPDFIARIGKRFLKVPYISLPNILLKEEIYPEFVHQKEVKEKLFNKIVEILASPKEMKEKREKLKKLSLLLGPRGASWRIAEDMVNYMKKLKRP